MNRRNTILLTIFVVIIIIITALFLLLNNSKLELGTSNNPLSIDTIERLASIGDQLEFNDFAKFEGRNIGSGLYVFQYYVEDDFILRWIHLIR